MILQPIQPSRGITAMICAVSLQFFGFDIASSEQKNNNTSSISHSTYYPPQ